MTVYLEDTTAGAVAMAIAKERFAAGSSAVGRVLTAVIVADESAQADAVRAAVGAAREHPCRILVTIPRPGREHARLDAAVTVGGADGLGEVAELRLRGPLSHHAESVILPLLVPDAPVVAWWPSRPPDVPADDPVGRLAARRVTDAATATHPLDALRARRDGYRPGDTDLAWTRITPWRALLAAIFDQPIDPISAITVQAESSNPSAHLLAAWLHMCLDVPVACKRSRGPGITGVAMVTSGGDITVTRTDGRVAHVERPGQTARESALPRRDTASLVAEELRRLDADEVFEATLRSLDAVDASAGAEPAT